MTVERIALPPDEIEALVKENEFFGSLDAGARAFVCEHLEPHWVPGGVVLMHQGDPADCLYLVAFGRLRVTMTREDGGEVTVAELGRGTVVGELGLITDEPRSATVTALRDTQVLRLSTSAYTQLVQEHPEALRQITSEVTRRLVRSLREGTPTSPVVTIAVVPLDDNPLVREFAARLHRSLDRLTGAARHLTATVAREAIGDLDVASADRLAAWFAQHDSSMEVAIYEADPAPTRWTESCVRQADLLLLVADGRAAPGVRPVERVIDERRSRVQCRTELVLLHPAETRDPRRTRRWLAVRTIDRHHHVRVDRDADVDQTARLLLGQGIGVVFSGGGARGIAGVGVLQALAELNVPIDAVGGTSIGCLIAGGVARRQSPEQIALQLRHNVLDASPFDVTFPVISLTAGKRVTQNIQEAADDLDGEDMWRPAFCVSTNLTKRALEIHRHGAGWHNVRASFAIPGVFPPMRNAEGDVLVDGGVLDNLPVGVMRSQHSGITVIAVDVGRTRDLLAGSLPDGGVVSGWKMLLSRLDPGAPKDRGGVSLFRILMRLTELGSAQSDDRGDVYIRPAIDAYGIADFKAFDRLIELGYEAGRETLRDWLSSDRAPKF